MNNRSFFLSIGRLTKQKNHELLINLYKKYKIKEKLLIIGDGELKSYLVNLISDFKLEKKIFLLNYKKEYILLYKKSKSSNCNFIMGRSRFCNDRVCLLKKTGYLLRLSKWSKRIYWEKIKEVFFSVQIL